jgi:hypothetical protein
MSVTTINTDPSALAIKPNRHRLRINYALAATLIASGVTLEHVARQVGAKNADSLRVGLARRGVTAMAVRNAEGNIRRLTTVATRLVSQASEDLREKYANLLSKTAAKLNQIPIKANTKSLKALGEAAEPFVRMAKIVHDWGNQSKEGMAMVGLWQEPAPQEPQGQVMDIQAVVVEPEKPSNPS